MFDRIKRAIYRPDFFRDGNFTANRGMAFYSLSVLVLAVGLSGVVITALFGVNRFFDSAEWKHQESLITRLYSSDLVLTFDDGRLLTNQSDPVSIPFPMEWRNECGYREGHCNREVIPAHLLVIDREATLSPQAFTQYDTLALANETEIGFRNPERGETRVFALSEFQTDKPIVVTDERFAYWVSQIGDIAEKGIYLVMYALPLAIYAGLWVGYLAYALLGALIVMIAAHIQGHTLRYSQAYLAALYLLPVSFLFSFLMTLSHNHIPFVFTLILFVMALLNFPKAPKLPDPVKIASTDTPVSQKLAEVDEKLVEEKK